MLNYFPRVFSNRATLWYVATLVLVSFAFLSRIMPFQFMLFGIVEVSAFFYFSTVLPQRWGSIYYKTFVRKIFWTALVIRLVYMVFSYFYYTIMTGQPFMYHTADEQMYYGMSKVWRETDFTTFRQAMQSIGFSDSGEIYITSFVCWLFGPYIIPVRVLHCFASAATCVLIYRIASRHFEESTARMAAIFCMLMPNLIYYCGTHLKEADMVFFAVLFVDSVDKLLLTRKFDFKILAVAMFSALAAFSFRTVLGAVGIMSALLAVVFLRGRLGSWWKRIVMILAVAVGLGATSVGDIIMREVGDVWDGRTENQEQGLEYRAQRAGGNTLATYASAAVFAPAIFTIPFPTMVNVEGQENQMMINGGNFVKNVMSGFTIFALIILLTSGNWRKHILLIAMLVGYLVVIAFSNFAQSERFHQPALPFELMFAAYGLSQLKAKHKSWFNIWLVFICVANVAWAWFKLAGRGLV